MPGVIAAFVAEHPLAEPQPVRIRDVWEQDGQIVQLFYVRYGPPQDCPSGCFYNRAVGLRRAETAGWIDHDGYPGSETFPGAYPFSAADSLLYTQQAEDEVEKADDRALADLFFAIARAPTAPRDVLARLISRLPEPGHPYDNVGWVLLANPAVSSDSGLLQMVAALPGEEERWELLRERARELLAAQP